MNIENEHPEENYSNWKAPEVSSEKSEKQKKWEQIAAEVEQITDSLGKGVDEGIKETVIALKAYEFPTDQSCEGHMEGEHDHPYPWMQIYAPEPEGWQEDEEKQKEWTRENLKEQQKMLDLLAEFYQSRNTPFDARITFDKVGAFGGFRIQSMGADTMQLLNKEDLAEKVKAYKQEMADFTEFLKDRYFI